MIVMFTVDSYSNKTEAGIFKNEAQRLLSGTHVEANIYSPSNEDLNISEERMNIHADTHDIINSPLPFGWFLFPYNLLHSLSIHTPVTNVIDLLALSLEKICKIYIFIY